MIVQETDLMIEFIVVPQFSYASRYNTSMVVRYYAVQRGFTLLPKPFTAEKLVSAVVQAIGPGRRARQGV